MKNSKDRRFPEILMAAMLGLSLVAAGACGADEPEVAETPGAAAGGAARTGAGEEAGVDVAAVVDNPASFAGRTVTVRGEVEEIYSPRGAFALTGGGIVAENQLMVLVKGDKAPMLEEDRQVRVTGRVRAYAVAEIEEYERELGWQLTPELRGELEKVKAVMIAESITPVAQQE